MQMPDDMQMSDDMHMSDEGSMELSADEQPPNVISELVLCNWENIVKGFETSFDYVFSSSKKAHFDSVPDAYSVVDGARSRWWPLLLLDSVIYLLTMQHWNFASRRAFNQHKVLFDCILAEIREDSPQFYKALSDGMYAAILVPNATNTEDVPAAVAVSAGLALALECHAKLPGLSLVQSPDQWASMQQWKDYVSQDPPTKSKLKYTTLIDFFVLHPMFNGQWSLHDIKMMLIAKVVVFYGRRQYTEEGFRSRMGLPVFEPRRVTVRIPRVRSADTIPSSMGKPMVCSPHSAAAEQQTKTRKRRRQPATTEGSSSTSSSVPSIPECPNGMAEAGSRLASLHIEEDAFSTCPMLLTPSPDRGSWPKYLLGNNYSCSSTEHDDQQHLGSEAGYQSATQPVHCMLSYEDLVVHPFIFEDNSDHGYYHEDPSANMLRSPSNSNSNTYSTSYANPAAPYYAATHSHSHSPDRCSSWHCNSLHDHGHGHGHGHVQPGNAAHGYSRAYSMQQHALPRLPSISSLTPRAHDKRQHYPHHHQHQQQHHPQHPQQQQPHHQQHQQQQQGMQQQQHQIGMQQEAMGVVGSLSVQNPGAIAAAPMQPEECAWADEAADSIQASCM